MSLPLFVMLTVTKRFFAVIGLASFEILRNFDKFLPGKRSEEQEMVIGLVRIGR